LVGVSFILGTFLGGKFSDATINEAFTPDFPFWFAAILGFCNFFFVFFAFKETFIPHEEVKVDRWEGIHNIQAAVQTSKLKPAYLIYFLFIFAWTLLFQFMPVRMIRSFSYTSSQIGNLAAFMGFCWALGSGLLNKLFLKKFHYLKVLELTLFIFTGVCFAIAIPVEKMTLLALLGLCVVFGGMAWPLCTTMISDLSPKNTQGRMLGVSQSMQSLAMATAPILGGFVDQIYPQMPFLLAAIAGLMAAWTYFFVKP
jgi:MFS family permease